MNEPSTSAPSAAPTSRATRRATKILPAFALLAGALLSPNPAHAADPDISHDPAAELASFQIADGFEVNLFASEKDGLIKPIQMRFDTRGRLWVIGSVVYPQLEPGQKPNDKVLILEDNDQDGRCDNVKVFADSLMIPTGLELVGDGAYVGHGPELLLLRDTNGDDRADERTVVFRGFGTGDNHQNINSFTWGPSGELWMCQGLHIHSHIETPYGLVQLERAGIWRLWPRRRKLEGFYGSEHEPQNPWGHVFNEWGEHIVLAGNNSSPMYPDPGLVPRRRNDPPPLIWPEGKGRKVSGGDFVANAHFPDDWQGRLILGGYINNAVWSVNVVDEGAGFRFEDAPPLIRSTSRAFRPVDVKFGPDGALYLCDWYNPIIGHYQASFRHPDRDKAHGRIWRVTAKNRPLNHRPELARAGAGELIALLESPDRWTRQFAARELSNRPSPEVLPALKEAAPFASDVGGLRILGLFQAHEMSAPELIARLCQSTNAHVRAFAASAVGLSRPPDALELLRPLVADENARVALQALIACANLDTPEAIEVAAIAADYSFDRFGTYAFNQTVHSLKPHWLPRLQSGELKFEKHPARLAAIVRADGTADTVEALRKFAALGNPDFLEILAEVGGPDDLAAILQRGPASLGGDVLRHISERSIKASGDLKLLLEPFFDRPRPSPYAMLLAAQWKVEPLFPRIRRFAGRDFNYDPAAIAALGRIGASELPLLRKLATDPISNLSRAEAFAQWQQFEPNEAAASAAEFLAAADEISTEHLIRAFLRRPESSAALARALAHQKLPAKVTKAALTVLSASGRRNDELARALTGRGSIDPNISFENGDPKRGEQIYLRPELGCVACHKVNGHGGAIGPDLSALGTAQPIDFIVGAIVDPQKEIKEGFASISIATKSGDDFQGYFVRESTDEIVLRDPLLNQDIKIRRADVASRRANGSLMPNGLADQLSPDDFRDLVKYLSTLGQP